MQRDTATLQGIPFLGRDQELEILRTGMDSAKVGQGRVILIGGEAGIGKTRIVQEFVDGVAQREALTLWASCNEWEGAPAFRPWTQIMRSYVHVVDKSLLHERLGPTAGHIAQIFPDIHDQIPGIPTLPVLDPAESRFRLFDAVATFLRNAATQQPIVIVLDDVHWADEPSLLLLQFVAQEIHTSNVLVIATHREHDLRTHQPLARTVAAIARERGSQRIFLPGLSEEEIAQYVRIAIAHEPPPSLVNAVYQETEGNPFFITEIVRLLLSDGTLKPPLQASAWRLRIPESVRVVIGRRLDRLSRNCYQTLSIAAVIGREFEFPILERIVDFEAIQILDALDEAQRAQIIQDTNTTGLFHFGHTLVREALYLQLTTARRAQVHMMVGETIEQLYAGHLSSHYAELAHHFRESLPLGDPDKACTYSALAGDHAMERVAWELAVIHYQHALQALPLTSSIDPLLRCNLLIALGTAQNRSGPGSGDAPDARASFLEAATVARDQHAAESFAQAAIGYAGFNISAAFGGIQQVKLLEEALDHLGSSDTTLRVQVLSRLAEDLAIFSPETQTRVRFLGDEAVASARRTGDPSTLAVALAARHFSGTGPDNLNERLKDAAELLTIAEQAEDRLTVTWASFWGNLTMVLDLVEQGNIDGANRAMRAVEITAAQAKIPYITLRAIVYRNMLLLMAGRFAEAEPLIEQARELWQSEDVQQHLFQAFALKREQGQLVEEFDEFQAAIQRPTTGASRYNRLRPVYELALLLETGHETEARRQFEIIAGRDFSDIPADMSWHGVMALLAEACSEFGDRDRAATLYGLLLPYADRMAVLAVSAVCLGSLSYYLGLLATTLSRWDDAETHFDSALRMHQRGNMQPYVAYTHYAHAVMLAERGRTGDTERAARFTEQAMNITRQLGMRRLEQKIERLEESLPSSAPASAVLTPRETEVLRLITRGLTDAEIARQLDISPRTVNTHVRSLFAKLEVPSRAAATRVAIEQGLI